jgi:uncharacterized repeat protein (TIGR03803 family)
VPHQFQGPPDAAFARNGMVADGSSGNFYGATVRGGAQGEGAIHRFTPNQTSRDLLVPSILVLSDDAKETMFFVGDASGEKDSVAQREKIP